MHEANQIDLAVNFDIHTYRDNDRLLCVADSLCDGNAVIVEKGVDYWVDTVGQFCPAGVRIVAINIAQP